MSQTKQNIDIRRYLEVRSAYAPSFRWDDKTMYFLSTISGMPQIWALDAGTPWPRQITFFSDRVMGMAASPTQPYLVINADIGGSENAQLFLCDADALQLENLSNDPNHIYSFGAWASDGRSFSYASNRRDGRHFDVYVYNIDSRTNRAVHTSDFTNYAGGFTPDGRQVVVSRHYSNLNNDLFLVNLETGETIHLTPHEGEARFIVPTFSDDGQTCYLLSDKESEFTRLAQIDVANQGWTWLTPDEWDAEGLRLSSDKQFLAYTVNEDGASKLKIRKVSSMVVGVDSDPGFAGDAELTITNLPEGVIASITWHRTTSHLAVVVSSPEFGIEIWDVGVEHGEVNRLTYASISGVPQDTFVKPELVHYPSFDGRSIPAFYYRPKTDSFPTGPDAGDDAGQAADDGEGQAAGSEAGPYPVVVYVHGGPESQSRNSFNGIVQYFVNQGFAVFVPNVRGSSGYGRNYVHLDDVRKRMDSVADLAKAVDWLVTEGNAKKDAIAVMGGSYGGFMVLAAVTHYPDLWAAGVDIVGIANLRTFIENTSPYRRHLREPEYGTIESDGDFFDEISPIHHVNKITAPMLVIHGANDPRVPVGEAEQIVAALRERNHKVDYLRFEDEGHGIVKLNNRITAYGRVASFLKECLQ